MIHTLFDWQRAYLAAWIETLRVPLAAAALDHILHAPSEVLTRTLAAAGIADRPLDRAVERDAPFSVAVEPLLTDPFARVLRLRGPQADRRLFFLMTPHSGYAAAVMSSLVATLLSLGEVVVTEWRDARLVPTSAGGFGLIEQVSLGRATMARLERPAHFLGLSQSGPAMLALAALLARDAPALAPKSLAFLGAQLDPQVGLTALQHLLAVWPRDLLAANLLAPVPDGLPGAGRRVYPSVFQLLAYSMASPGLYAQVQHGLLHELQTGRPGIYHRQHTDLHSLVDLPGELFLDMLDWALDGSAWDGDGSVVVGEPLDAARLCRVPLLTIEADQDELVGGGQTHILHQRLRPRTVAHAATLSGARHHDLFTGPGFLARTAPLLQRFYTSLDP